MFAALKAWLKFIGSFNVEEQRYTASNVCVAHEIEIYLCGERKRTDEAAQSRSFGRIREGRIRNQCSVVRDDDLEDIT